MQGQPADRAMLAQRIQGFGNVNPPPLQEDTAASTAKKAVGRLGEMVGEEVMLTVEDFREKGAVGAVKDAVADAGDILIDGVSGIIGWIRGDPPGEDENEKAEDATKALSYGPNGAAYGISQASPTGGINAVWVMPDEADPAAMAQLASQGAGTMINDPRVPKGIVPYQPPASSKGPAGIQPYQPAGAGAAGYQIPGGPVIAPYQPAPSGPGGFRAPPYIPGGAGGFQPGGAGPWGPGGFQPGGAPAGYAPGAGGASSSSPGGNNSGAKGLVERLSKGEVLVGPDVVKRLVSQCNAAKTTGKQLADMVCERTRRLYLGLDGGDPGEADAALARLLSLTDALKTDSSDLAKSAAEEIKKGVNEEFLSLRSSAKHQATALPMLKRLGMVEGGAAASPTVDLLGGGGGGGSGAAQEADLLGGVAQPAAEVDLLGGGGGASGAPATSALGDLLGGAAASSSSAAGPASLDPLAPQGQAGGVLGGLTLNSSPSLPASLPAAPAGPVGTTLGTGAVMQEAKKEEDIFGFVGAEMSKANKK